MPEGPPIGFHVTCRLTDGRVIAPTRNHRLTVARTVLDQFRGRALLAFNTPDTHLHTEHAEPEEVGSSLLANALRSIKLTLKLPVGFAKPFPKPIRSQAHLFNTFDYVLGQQPHHELEWDPYHEASNLPDLLGLRVLGRYTADNVRRLLPRLKRHLLLKHLGVEAHESKDGPPRDLLAATGLTDLHGRCALTRAARRAAVVVANAGATLEQLARLLETDRKSLWRARQKPADPDLVRAIRLQLQLRQLVPAAPTGAFSPDELHLD